MALVKCPHCGKEIDDSAETCPYCGSDLEGKNEGEEKRPVPDQRTEDPQDTKLQNMKRMRNILAVALCVATAGLIGVTAYGTTTISSLRTELSGVRAEAASAQSDYKSAKKKLKASQADTDSVREELTSVQSEYDSYKEKMAPFEEMTAAQAEQQKAAAKAAQEESENQKTANEAVNKLWDDKTGLKDGATRAEYNDAVDKVNKVGDTSAKNALNEKLKAIDDSMTAKEQAAAAEEAAGYETGITYDQLARTPDQYMNKKVKFRGKVIQVIEDSSSGRIQIRLAVGSDYDKVLLGEYDSSIVSKRVLEDDTITIYGTSVGTITYQSTMGGMITIPGVSIEKIDQ